MSEFRKHSSHPGLLQFRVMEVLQWINEGMFDVDIQSIFGLSNSLQSFTHNRQSPT